MTVNNMTPEERRVEGVIAGSLCEAGYSLLRVKFIDGSHRTLQIMIDRMDGESITVDDCEKASRFLSVLLDVEDIVTGEYHLEVSSAGIDRPLMTIEDFEKFKGFEVKFSTSLPVGNGKQKKFKGRILSVTDNTVEFSVPNVDEVLTVSFDQILTAKLVLNDELLDLRSV